MKGNAKMKANCTYDIKRELAKFERVVLAAFRAGKITKDVCERQLDAVATVELAIPVQAYDAWHWTDEARANLAKIRAFNSRH